MPPSDRPYHLLARTSSYRWWRPLVELVAFGVVGVALMSIVMKALPVRVDQLIEHGGATGLIGLSLMLAVGIPAAKIAAAASGRSAGEVSSVVGRLRWRWLGRCALVAFVVLAVSIAVDLVVAPQAIAWPGWAAFAPLGLAVLVFTPLQAAGEEYVFRGTLLQTLGAWIPWSWVPVAISSALFAIAHGLRPEQLVGILGSGLIMGWLAIRTGGLEASIALHAVNNIVAFMLVAASGEADSWLSRLDHDLPWISVAVGVVFQLVYAAIVVKMRTSAART